MLKRALFDRSITDINFTSIHSFSLSLTAKKYFFIMLKHITIEFSASDICIHITSYEVQNICQANCGEIKMNFKNVNVCMWEWKHFYYAVIPPSATLPEELLNDFLHTKCMCEKLQHNISNWHREREKHR